MIDFAKRAPSGDSCACQALSNLYTHPLVGKCAFKILEGNGEANVSLPYIGIVVSHPALGVVRARLTALAVNVLKNLALRRIWTTRWNKVVEMEEEPERASTISRGSRME